MLAKRLKTKGSCLIVLLLCCVLLMQTACSQLQLRDSRKADLLILHTNDTHSHIAGIDKDGNACLRDQKCRGGLARISAAIRDAKQRGENVLALDAGDMFQGTLFYSINKWPMLADLNALMPWDAATLGNHEWDEGCGELAKYIEANRHFPLLAANLKPQKGCPLLSVNILPYSIREIGGHKVGVIGISNDKVVGLASACPQTRFSNRVETVQAVVRELEGKGVRRIVLLTHIGLPDDRKLARCVDGVDIIVGGHSHSYLGPDSSAGPYPIVEESPSGKPVLVVTAKRGTQYLGELFCSFDSAGVLTAWSGRERELQPSDPRDELLSAKIAGYASSLVEYRSRKLGSHSIDLGPDGLDACRKHECLTGMIVADAMLDFGKAYGAQIALCNSGSIRAPLGKGTITLGDIFTAFPFNQSIVLRECSGEQLWEALEHGVAGEGSIGPQMLQVAGLRYIVDAKKPAGKRVLKVEALNVQKSAAPLNPRERYLVALPKYIANGGDFFAMLTTCKVVPSSEPLAVDLLSAYLTKYSPLLRPVTGRIVRKEKNAF